jgi:transposase
MDLTDAQYTLIEPLLPKQVRRKDGKGRPPHTHRDVLNGILWVLRTGAPWKDLPERYPSYSTCYRRFATWSKQKVMMHILRALAEDLVARGKLDLSETFIDATFAAAKKGVLASAKHVKARAQSSWPWQTAMVYLSQLTWIALHPTKQNLSKLPLTLDSHHDCLDASLATKPMIQTDSTISSRTSMALS